MAVIEDIDSLNFYIQEKLDDGVALAFSGGVDSALLLDIIYKLNKKPQKFIALTFKTEFQSNEDIILSQELTRHYGIRSKLIEVNVLDNEELSNNPKDRCYLCKKNIFAKLLEIKEQEHLKHIFDGTNADDLDVHRPGLKALREMGVSSPLADLGIGKDRIRMMANHLKIPVATRPSAPCLATRFPHNTRLDKTLMHKLDQEEKYLKGLGLSTIRLRVHNNLIRIEVPNLDFKKVLDYQNLITTRLKKIGFDYISLDIEGFRSGSMDL